MIWFLVGLPVGLACGAVVLLIATARFRGRLAKTADRASAAEDKAAAAEAANRTLRRMAELGSITGALAHEIKNPLSTVGLNLRLLEEDLGGAEPRLQNRLAVVQRETTRLRDILDDFLRYAGKMELDRRPTDLNALLLELVDFFAPQAQLQRVQLRLRPPEPPGAPIIADIDPKATKQAVLNLMINAVQAMNNGGELILSAAPTGNGQVVVHVIDTGPGIPHDALDKIFLPDYSTKKGGTGLGLPMARRIAEEHGG